MTPTIKLTTNYKHYRPNAYGQHFYDLRVQFNFLPAGMHCIAYLPLYLYLFQYNSISNVM